MRSRHGAVPSSRSRRVGYNQQLKPYRPPDGSGKDEIYGEFIGRLRYSRADRARRRKAAAPNKTGDPSQTDRRFSITANVKMPDYRRLNEAIGYFDIFIPPIDDPFAAPVPEAAAGALAAPVSADALATAFL